MSRFSPSEAALEGFRLIRRRPLTIGVWALINALGVAAIGALMLLALGGPLIDVIRKGDLQGLDPDKLGLLLAEAAPAFLGIVAVVFLFSAMLVAGVFRVVLEPQDKGQIHLKMGVDELRLAAANFLIFVPGAVWVGFVNIVGAGVAAQYGLPMGLFAAFVVLAPLVFVGVRLLLFTPMIFATHRVDLTAAWHLTKGRFWPLFGMFALAASFYVIVWLLIFTVHGGLLIVAGGAEAISDAGEHGVPAALPVMVLVLALEAVLPVLQLVLLTAPLAVAYRDITAGDTEAPASPATPQLAP